MDQKTQIINLNKFNITIIFNINKNLIHNKLNGLHQFH